MVHSVWLPSKNTTNFLCLVACPFDEVHIWITRRWLNTHLGLLGNPANLHFNVYLFLPHNCLYKKHSEAPKSLPSRGTIVKGEKSLGEAEKEFTCPRNKGSSQNVIQQQVGSLDKYTFAWDSAVSNHISPKFYDVNHINYVVQCAKTFSAFSFCQWTLI